MTDLAATIARLRAIERAATPGPWGCYAAFIDEWTAADMEFVDAARNAMPRLLDVVEAAQFMVANWTPEATDRLSAALAALAKEANDV